MNAACTSDSGSPCRFSVEHYVSFETLSGVSQSARRDWTSRSIGCSLGPGARNCPNVPPVKHPARNVHSIPDAVVSCNPRSLSNMRPRGLLKQLLTPLASYASLWQFTAAAIMRALRDPHVCGRNHFLHRKRQQASSTTGYEPRW